MKNEFALFRLGFRPFFLGAAVFAILSMLLWMAIYNFTLNIPLAGLPPTLWHAHEMLFGYTLAIIAGFLLTAVKNWTNIPTPHGYKLATLFMLWVLARIMFVFIEVVPLGLLVVVECLFIVVVLISSAIPIMKIKQWRQLIILTILVLLLVSDITFYLGLADNNYKLMSLGIYASLYLVLAMVIIMGGRVIPFFIESGVGYRVQLKNKKWMDGLCIILFLAFAITELFYSNKIVSTLLAASLFIFHALRMASWHTAGIWKKPLLWILYIAYGLIVAGFVLKLMQIYFNVSPFLVIHAFSYGGISVITLGMICRIIWGHTGRNISQPPKAVSWIFASIIIGAVVRVFVPLLTQEHYLFWLGVSQSLWIIAFALFLYIYTPILIQPRPDGQYG